MRGKIQIQKVAVMGQSCGGFLSLTLGADPRVNTIGVFNAGIRLDDPNVSISFAPTADALPHLHGPVLLVNGHDRDFMTPASKLTFEKIDTLPVFYGARHNAGHTATVFHPGGGEYANVASNWLMWTLKGDAHAGAMFVGADCGLCKDPNWDVRAKKLAH
jgi:hypothetical protein